MALKLVGRPVEKQAMSTLKMFKKGEYIFREGDKASAVYLIQSGTVSVCLVRPKKNVELFVLGAPHIVGDQALQGLPSHQIAALCTSDVKAIEFGVDLLKQQLASSPQAIQMIMKSAADRMRALVQEVRSVRLERDTVPIPEDQVSRALGALFHAAVYRGKKEGEDLVVQWLALKQHAQRIFGESPKRLEQSASVLAKLKFASFVRGKDETDPEAGEVVVGLRIHDLAALESTVDFYQHYYFKGGRTDILKIEDGPTQVVAALLKCCEGATLDRHGVAIFEYGKIVERLKTEFGIAVKADHWARLEQKGLFARLKQTEQGVFLHLELAEFQRVYKSWRILREIDKLNERGFVDMNEDDSVAAKRKSTTGHSCPTCGAEAQENQKFCGECGGKLSVAA